MGEYLLARVLQDTQSAGFSVEWVDCDANKKGTRNIRVSSVEEFNQMATGKEVVFIYPGERVLLRSVNIPGSWKLKLAQVLPFALEDEIADELSEVHISHTKLSGSDSIPVAITNKQILEQYIQQLEENYHPHKYLLPESLLLPCKDGVLSIFCQGNSVTLKYGMFEGCTIHSELTETVITKILAESQHSHIEKAFVWGDQDGSISRLLASSDTGLVVETGIDQVDQFTGFFDIANLDKTVLGMNLLQGRSKSTQGGSNWFMPKNVAAAVMLVLAVVLLIGSQGYHYLQLKEQNDTLQAQIQQSFKKAFPEVKRMVDPLVQARQKLQNIRSKSSAQNDQFMDMLYLLGDQLRQDSAISLVNVEYVSGRMDVLINTDAIVDVEQLAFNLSSDSHFNAEILSTKTSDDGVQARMKIRGEL